ncbi:MAG: hypothetical protein LBP33_03955 [Candidatus Adiutrix sp.]|jgi:hypothetical protein|nr:hypothetical protein [Candidatus Adiutrix sp.]
MLFRKKSPPRGQDQVLAKTASDEDDPLTGHVQAAESASEAAPAAPAPSPAPRTPAPEAEATVAAQPAAPVSQALLDIREAGLTPEEAAEASKALAEENQRKEAAPKAARPASKNHSSGREGAEKLVLIARFRWTLLLVLSLASVLTWAGEAAYAHRPYQWYAWGWLALTLLITLPTGRFLRLPTRGGLAAWCWAATFFLEALYGPEEMIFRGIPAALPWAGLLVLILFWLGVAIWRKLGRYKVVDILLSVLVVYALLGPVLALTGSVTVGGALNLKFAALSGSPDLLSRNLPWFLWPMSVMVGLMLPLAALFSLGDQLSALKRKGGRHGGNFFLALAFLTLIPYGFLSFDRAVGENPEWARAIRSIWPEAAVHARENMIPVPAAMRPAAMTENPEDREPEISPPPSPTVQSLPEASVPVLAAPEEVLPTPEEAGPAPADNEALKRRVDELEKRLQALEDRLSEAAPAEALPPPQTLETEARSPAAPEPSPEDELERRLRVLEEGFLEAPGARPAEPVAEVGPAAPPALDDGAE